ncbi:MAG: UDP-glucose/GDP-mannose dehydrogenase family protein [Spirochaetales bacterium]|nr:UDP-glucose/GDP-mannose dehydrogenase family protein [Spirochaetales bacterium]
MHNITVLGTGYVGLVTGSCLSDFGLEVTCCDVDQTKIDTLNSGGIPIYEEGLDLIIKRNRDTGRLTFTSDIKKAVEAAKVIFIAVGTPARADGTADLSYVENAVKDIAKYINNEKVIVSKSTVPIGTTRKIKKWLEEDLKLLKKNISFEVISNPEFLREGSAVYDFMHPDRVIIGYESDAALAVMKDVYRVLYLNETPFVETTLETAETIKYASNSFLALKISYINQIAELCEKTGANVADVAKAMGKDGRIGSKFLHPGPGYGGSCFPKDTHAFAAAGRKYGSPLTIIETVINFNETHKQYVTNKIITKMGAVKDKTIGILGLAFKPNTDDMRDASSIFIIPALLKKGAKIRVYDPAAMKEAREKYFKGEKQIAYCTNEYDTLAEADALVILTEWNQFRNLDIKKIKTKMTGNFFFDYRNIYKRKEIEAAGFVYEGIGV